MGILKKTLKIIGLGLIAIIFATTLTEAGMEGDSSLFKAILGWLIGFAVIGWCVSAIAKKLQKRRGMPISNDPLAKRFSDWLLRHEALLQLGYRITIVLLLALGIDKMDRHSWSIANEQLRQLGRIESRLSGIEDHASNIEDHASNIEGNTSK